MSAVALDRPPHPQANSSVCGFPAFNRTVDVLELVCEAVGYENALALLALRACSHAWADAVSGVMHRGSVEAEMSPTVARMCMAARLCVVSQHYGAVQGWLTVVPATVLQNEDPDRFVDDVRVLMRIVPRPTALHFDNYEASVCEDVAALLTASAAATLTSIRATNTIVSCRAAAVLARMPALRSLTFTGGDTVSDYTLLEIARGCPQLEHLDVSHTYGTVTNRGVTAIAQHCQQLRYLDVRFTGSDVTDAAVAAVARHCPLLEHLRVAFTSGSVTDASLTVVAAFCPNLRFLDASNTSISDVAIEAIARQCPELAHLEVPHSTGRVTNASICCVADCCPALQFLDIANTRVTADAVRAVAQRCTKLRHLDMSMTCDGSADVALAALAAHATQL
eukprot:CAMPEP_0174878772 /NCGR_PEP_ID=MMETSP1114-20130205/82927_1 /TAXON_ID=312471 /ORGANISM="Neobodo designis, Strain CCAP 1951/1" /LENGTH=393 /DNA_ID=CAMNT_0016114161 /DNA_START=41 /DNA_END=1219 /DNA_ORIENTATION=+